MKKFITIKEISQYLNGRIVKIPAGILLAHNKFFYELCYQGLCLGFKEEELLAQPEYFKVVKEFTLTEIELIQFRDKIAYQMKEGCAYGQLMEEAIPIILKEQFDELIEPLTTEQNK